VSQSKLFAGANAMAIGNGSSGNWEIFQFREAQLVAAGTYALGWRLRGQLGTDGIIPDVWPSGSQVVMLNGQLRQMSLPATMRGVALTLRIGALSRGPEDASTTPLSLTPMGNGLRPYPIAHLQFSQSTNGDWSFVWVRRTRIDGDNWEGFEVPIGEDSELYQVEIWQGINRIRQVFVSAPEWTYLQSQQLADGVSGTFEVKVAQVSQAFGPGPTRSIFATA
ncbi:MAG: phage tail baseplate protein, partial [Paracoccaceae bacterium]